jgi:hypothetical protein
MMCVARSFPLCYPPRYRPNVRPSQCNRHASRLSPTEKSRHVLTIHTLAPFSILIGEIDEERDRAIDLSTIRADPVAPIRY